MVDFAEVTRNSLNGRSLRNGKVNMPVDAQARQAIVSLDKTIMDGKIISVSEWPSGSEWPRVDADELSSIRIYLWESFVNSAPLKILEKFMSPDLLKSSRYLTVTMRQKFFPLNSG